MRPLTKWTFGLALCCALWPSGAIADEIVLKSGERFSSNKIWRENGKIQFNMHGLLVSVNPADVVSIERQGANAIAPSREAPPPTPKAASAAAKAGRPSPKPAPASSRKAANPADRSKSHPNRPRVSGVGINGIQWQMKPSQVPGIEKGKTDPAYGGITQYHHTRGPLGMGEALLDGLVFGFWQDRLYTVTIWVDGKPAYERLQQAVFRRHGQGRKNKSGLERYVWLEKTTDRMLEFDEKLNTGIFWMRSRELDQYIKQRYPDP